MANTNFDLGLAKCRLRDSIIYAEGKYFRYIVKNNLDFKDKENIYVKNIFELANIKDSLYEYETEADVQAIMNRITELRKFIDEVK